MPSAVATLTILHPGERADAIVGAIAKVVPPQLQDDGSYRLAFEHATPVNAEAVLAAALKMAGTTDWREFATVEVEGLPSWLYVQDPLRRRKGAALSPGR